MEGFWKTGKKYQGSKNLGEEKKSSAKKTKDQAFH